MKTIEKPTFAWPLLDIDQAEIDEILRLFRLWDSRKYKYGGKAKGTSALARSLRPVNIDCSGFVGVLLDAATDTTKTPSVLWDKGSWQQYDALSAAGLKETTSFYETDGVLRLAYLDPDDTASGIGHVALILNGATIESCGSLGVCRRVWGTRRWMNKAKGLVLAIPGETGEIND